jgi:hypothetical protein
MALEGTASANHRDTRYRAWLAVAQAPSAIIPQVFHVHKKTRNGDFTRLSDDSAGQAPLQFAETDDLGCLMLAGGTSHACCQAAHNRPLQNSAETDIEGGVDAGLPLACVSANYGPVALSPAIKARRSPARGHA